MLKGVCAALLFSPCLAAAQDGVDQKAIDRAIDRGVEYLKPQSIPRQDVELVLWTMLHAGVPETDPVLQALLGRCFDEPIWESTRELTYNIVLMAMCLQKLDAVRYQAVLVQCGQFFADTQCGTGQWAYGESWKAPPEFTQALKSIPPKRDGAQKNRTATEIQIQRNPNGSEPEGDNSNSQYVALGIRACRDAGVKMPADVLQRAKAWWEKDQKADGSWGYGENPRDKGTGSMTVGGIGALAILNTLLKQPLKTPAVAKAFDWLDKHFSVKENPGSGEWPYYYLYGLERAGDLTETKTIGSRAWYPEGARELVATQNSDGSWRRSSAEETQVRTTCFAILFLKRATEPARHIATGIPGSGQAPAPEEEQGKNPYSRRKPEGQKDK